MPPLLDASVLDRLESANRAFEAAYPGDGPVRQPVHVVYGGAHLFRADIAAKLGALALRSLDEYAPSPPIFAQAMGWDADPRTVDIVYSRVIEKLRREPVEDFRIDFEDGYGHRPGGEEDTHADTAASELARGLAAAALPPAIGFRVKPLTRELAPRSLRTLERFLGTLVAKTAGKLPAGFCVTLPKVTLAEQVETLAAALEALESRLGLEARSLRFEIMVETPQALVGARGHCPLPLLVRAGAGRCIAAHFGAYDYTAALGITAAGQALAHPACDFARSLMQAALAGTGVWLSDGATTILPVGDRALVHRAWSLHFEHVRRALANGFHQGWDLHPAQLSARFGAVYSFFLENQKSAAERLSNFVARAARATLVDGMFDDAATGQGLLNYFLRAIACGATSEDEVPALTGLTAAELRTRSFLEILRGRV